MSVQPTWQSECGRYRLYHGDAMDVLPHVGRVNAVCTSPPYAMQRANSYGGVPEEVYPQWTLEWMRAVPLAEEGSILINIIEHASGGKLSDYILNTRIAVRTEWNEVDEMIWVKPNAPPAGNNFMPRRSWERVLWYSRSTRPACNCLDTTRESKGRINAHVYTNDFVRRRSLAKKATAPDYPRRPNYVICAVGGGTSGGGHTAAFPLRFAHWMVSFFSGTICDPFSGSGTIGVACVEIGLPFVGVERDDEYFRASVGRMEGALLEKTRPTVIAAMEASLFDDMP